METQTVALKNGQRLTIREAQPSDAETTLAYFEQTAGESSFLAYGAGEYKSTVERQVAFIESNLAGQNQVMLLAMIDDDLAGLVMFGGGTYSRNEHVGEFGISIKKKYWGQSIGSHLLQSLIDWARESGVIRKINLRVRTDNEAAVALYEKFGFENEGLLTRDMIIDGQFYDLYCMGMKID